MLKLGRDDITVPVCMFLFFCITDHTKVVLKISLKKMCHATQWRIQHSVHMDVVGNRSEKADFPVVCFFLAFI